VYKIHNNNNNNNNNNNDNTYNDHRRQNIRVIFIPKTTRFRGEKFGHVRIADPESVTKGTTNRTSIHPQPRTIDLAYRRYYYNDVIND